MPRKLPFHYGWVVVIAGTLGMFVSLGCGRLTLGMLLPSMGRAVGLDYAEMGLISTANFVGYLLAVLLVGRLVTRLGLRPTIVAGLMLVAGSLSAIAAAQGFVSILVLYFITGLGNGASFVPLMIIISHWFQPSARGRASGFLMVGASLAMMASGLAVPAVNAAFGDAGWRLNWLGFGLACVVVGLLAGLLLRNRPADLGLEPVGKAESGPKAPPTGAGLGRLVAHLGAIYWIFGFVYATYVTFVVTTMVDERAFDEVAAGHFWALMGLISVPSGPVFGAVSDRFGRRAAMIAVFAMQGLAYLLVAAALPDPAVLFSIVLFGLGAWAIPPIMAATVSDYMGLERAVRIFALGGLAMGVGQMLGPAVAGGLAEWQGNFLGGYALIAGLALGAVMLVAFLPRPAGKG